MGFKELSPQEAKSSLEEHAVPGILVTDERGNPEFIKKSFSSDFCVGLIHSPHLRRELPEIIRVLSVPLPFKVNGKLVFPRPGYDLRFGTFLLNHIHSEFCFTSDQSRIHAIARLLTPYARGILGQTTRVPFWFYCANRPRAGKDYLAAIPLLVYEGYAYEDLPIGKESEETSKRIVAAARSGRHYMHFSNCQNYLQDPYLAQVITNPIIKGRSLGSNSGASDLCLPNEMEFSMSGNVGITYREDFEPRMRKIELAYFEEDPNARVFKNKFLHQDIKERRGYVLSAIHSLFSNWAKQEFPKGTTPFVSFPEWAEVVGGVMMAAGLGDPCLPFKGEYDNVGGDKETSAMSELFRVCRAAFGDRWVSKKDIYKCVHEAMEEEEGGDALAHFGQLENSDDARKNQTRLGAKLIKFKGRELAGIKLLINAHETNSGRNKYRFVEAQGPENQRPGSVNLSTFVNLQPPRTDFENVSREKKFNEDNRKTKTCSDAVEVDRLTPLEDPPADSLFRP